MPSASEVAPALSRGAWSQCQQGPGPWVGEHLGSPQLHQGLQEPPLPALFRDVKPDNILWDEQGEGWGHWREVDGLGRWRRAVPEPLC